MIEGQFMQQKHYLSNLFESDRIRIDGRISTSTLEERSMEWNEYLISTSSSTGDSGIVAKNLYQIEKVNLSLLLIE